MIIFIVIFFLIIISIGLNIDNRSKENEKERELRLKKERELKQAIEQERASKKGTQNTNNATYIRDGNTHSIQRRDGQPISDAEIPDLIKMGYQEALEREKQSNNIKFARTEREEELSFQFMMNHGDEIEKHVNSFEECYRLAYKEDDLDKKIELLQKTITNFEKAKVWFYRTKGGTIYFQDMYEHMHNSRDDDYSYISQVEEYLEECIEERDYIIPEILDAIKSSNGILQKDIYQHLPDFPKSMIQKIIRKLENQGLITREKSGNTYLLKFKETL